MSLLEVKTKYANQKSTRMNPHPGAFYVVKRNERRLKKVVKLAK